MFNDKITGLKIYVYVRQVIEKMNVSLLLIIMTLASQSYKLLYL